jgi:hypothetical protein
MKSITTTQTLTLSLILGLVLAFVYSNYQVNQVEGSVSFGNEYKATTTNASTVEATRVLKNGPATLGSVVITGANTGMMVFYNATTTNPNFRNSNYSTSSIIIAEIPASAAAGTYTFDVDAPIGLVMSMSGTEPTTTITYR